MQEKTFKNQYNYSQLIKIIESSDLYIKEVESVLGRKLYRDEIFSFKAFKSIMSSDKTEDGLRKLAKKYGDVLNKSGGINKKMLLKSVMRELRHQQAMSDSFLINYNVIIHNTDLIERITQGLPPNLPKQVKNAISVVLGNFIYNNKIKGWMSVHLGRKFWDRLPKRYNPSRLSYRSIKASIDVLEKNGLLKTKRDFVVGGKQMLSRVKMTSETIATIKSVNKWKNSAKLHPSREILILKNKKKYLADYKDGPKATKIRNFLKKINSYSKTFGVTIDGEKHDIEYRRVFNDSRFDKGGRFYTKIQNEKKVDRKRVMINGEETGECDYKGLHINLLYAKEGLKSPDSDVYTVDGYENYRQVFKKALQACLNASDSKKAASAIQLGLNLENIKTVKGTEVLEVFKKKHDKIAKYFCTSVGKDLQFIDSQFAEIIFQKAMDNKVPVICIHDSFITNKNNVRWLKETMIIAAKSIFPEFDFGIDEK